MNSLQIDKVLGRLSITKPTYIGCFAADKIPYVRNNRYPHHMVVNVDPSNSFGTHWLAIFICSEKELDYYDSLGQWPPASPHIRRFLMHFSHIRYTGKQWQSDRSSACGKHAIYFLYNRCAGYTFQQILEKFARSKQNADRMVSTFVRRKIFDPLP